MKTNEKNNALVEKDNGIFIKIRKFFKKIFIRKNIVNVNYIKNESNINEEKDTFKIDIRNIENEDTKLLKLQKQYINGEVKEEELSEEQVTKLCQLFDKQIFSLKKANELLELSILETRKKLQKEV